jgi:hypothetical protein
MSRKGGRRQFLIERGGADRIGSSKIGVYQDLENARLGLKLSVNAWNRFTGGGGFYQPGWNGRFIQVDARTKVNVQWTDAFGVTYQTKVKYGDLMRNDGKNAETAIVRAFNGLRQAELQRAARLGLPAPRLGRALKKSDLVGARGYYFSVGGGDVYV